MCQIVRKAVWVNKEIVDLIRSDCKLPATASRRKLQIVCA